MNTEKHVLIDAHVMIRINGLFLPQSRMLHVYSPRQNNSKTWGLVSLQPGGDSITGCQDYCIFTFTLNCLIRVKQQEKLIWSYDCLYTYSFLEAWTEVKSPSIQSITNPAVFSYRAQLAIQQHNVSDWTFLVQKKCHAFSLRNKSCWYLSLGTIGNSLCKTDAISVQECDMKGI